MKALITLIVAVALAACGKQAEPGYRITCTLGDDVKADSMAIYAYSEDYRASRLLGSHKVSAHSRILTLEGTTDEPTVAFVRAGNRTTYFILENGNIDITIGSNTVGLRGTQLNADYYKVFAERCGIMNLRKSLRKKYDAMVAGGEITDSIDRQFEAAYKHTVDSLRRLHTRASHLHPVVAKAVWYQYSHDLPTPQPKN